jgi:putative membrane protein
MLIIYVLNKTIKPVLVTLTIPITGITLGLFYPCINVFILKLVDWILGSHFEVKNLFIALLVSILLSITNFIMEELIKHIIRKVKKYESRNA